MKCAGKAKRTKVECTHGFCTHGNFNIAREINNAHESLLNKNKMAISKVINSMDPTRMLFEYTKG